MGAGLELFGLRRDGGEFPAEIGLSPLQTDEGTLRTFIVIPKVRAPRFALPVLTTK